MNLDDLEKVLNSLDVIDSDLGGKSTEELRKKLIKKSKEDVLSFQTLKHLVLLIEFIGLSGKKSFKRIASKHYGEAKARDLWYSTKRNDPEKIEALKRRLAYVTTNAYVQWMNSDRAKDASEIRWALRCLKNKNMELLYWAYREVYLKSKDAEFRGLIPDYQQWIDAIENEAFSETATLSLMKEIASSE
jgi:hypothetical protein